jgi:Tol biopolymer transport system component
MQHYAISADGERVVFVVADDKGHSPVWVAALNRGSAPRQITTNDARKAFFLAGGRVVFEGQENGTKVVFRVKEDGSELQRVLRIDGPSALFSASPDGKWVVIPGSSDGVSWPAMLYAINGGPLRPLCLTCAGGNDVERITPPGVSWSADGKFLY